MPADENSPPRAGALRNHIRYRFDNLLSRGTWAVLLWLGAITVLTVLLSSLLLFVFDVTFSGSKDTSWLEDFWQSALRVLDPGTMAGDVGWGRRVLALLVTIFGLLIAGTLIGLIANGVEQRVETMRRGRSTVVETDHVVILGASARLPDIVEQLALAGRNKRSRAIVVLAEREPTELSEELHHLAAKLHGTRVVFRYGDPTRSADLSIVSVREARSVIVLNDDDGPGDAAVVRAVLAVGAELDGFDRIPIVAELSDPETADSVAEACGGLVLAVAELQSVAHFTAFALREPGLNQVVEELLDFRGCDIYVRDPGELEGTPFGELVLRSENARPIGIVGSDGTVVMNPEPSASFTTGDRLVVIADDDGQPELGPDDFAAPPSSRPITPAGLDAAPEVEHLLIIGWNGLGVRLLSQLQQAGEPGSTAEIVYDDRLFDADDLRVPTMPGFDVTLTPIQSRTWDLGDRASRSPITSILLLGYRRGVSAGEADNRTLLNLLLLRRELAKRNEVAPRVVVELLDADNVHLAGMTGADDYLISDAIVSRLMSQLAEQPERRAVLLTLYAPEGPSIQLVPANDFGLLGELGADQIIATTYASGQLAIGWRKDGTVVLNPRSSERVLLADGDQIVIVG
ncbi:MAG: hypothetical protein OEU32_11775 [Acidimicrobiia bacterium]|nr:hypothetical protein [Acidimicrobiia bacterium]